MSSEQVKEELSIASVVILCYTEIRNLASPIPSNIPVILVKCKVDEAASHEDDAFVSTLMKRHPNVELFVQCSALRAQQNVELVFALAHKILLFPSLPLIQNNGALSDAFTEALNHVFDVLDGESKGFLTEAQFQEFVCFCFEKEQSSYLKFAHDLPAIEPTFNENDQLSRTGFISLHRSMTLQGKHEEMWIILRSFGFDNNLQFNPKVPDCKENRFLSQHALAFLTSYYEKQRISSLDSLFWKPTKLPALLHCILFENVLTSDLWICLWTLLAALDPIECFQCLFYLGYPIRYTDDPLAAKSDVKCINLRSTNACTLYTVLNAFLEKTPNMAYQRFAIRRISDHLLILNADPELTLPGKCVALASPEDTCLPSYPHDLILTLDDTEIAKQARLSSKIMRYDLSESSTEQWSQILELFDEETETRKQTVNSNKTPLVAAGIMLLLGLGAVMTMKRWRSNHK